jgi:hypothetical protein
MGWGRGVSARLRLASALALAACTALASQARAETVLVAESGLIIGSQAADLSFIAPSAGTIDVRLTDLTWPTPLSSLVFSATSADSVLESMKGPGEVSFSVSSAGAYYAHLLGHAGGILGLGAYSLSMTFSPAAAVPLPAGLWLLLSGLTAGAIGLRSRRSRGAPAGSASTSVSATA